MITLTRRYAFAASHRLHSAALSDEANAQTFGKCNNPFGHGHNYVLSVTVDGQVDERTGLIVPIRELDGLLETHVLSRLAYRNLNQDVSEFRELVATTENLAVVIGSILEEKWPAWFGVDSGVRLASIHVQETGRNGFELRMARRASKRSSESNYESVIANA